MKIRRGLLLILLVSLPIPGFGATGGGASGPGFQGRSLAEALRILQGRGLKIIFSSEVVRPGMRVETEPRAAWPGDILDELLAPHGLRAEPGPGGTILVLPAAPSGSIRGLVWHSRESVPLPDVPIVVVGAKIEVHSATTGKFEIPLLPVGIYTLRASLPGFFPLTLEKVPVVKGGTTEIRFDLTPTGLPAQVIVVTPNDPAARRKRPDTGHHLSGRDLLETPNYGDDTLRALGRLPGVATSDGSARMNVRGGNDDELMFILDGLELYEPFHLRDRQDFLSIIDSRTIGGLQFFGGGFPAEYGGRMSGVIEMDSLAPSDELKSGITVSTDFAGVVNQGSFFRDRGHWLVAGRRGNPSHLLDAVGADMRYETRYHDLFGSAGVDLSLATRLSFHFLTAHDKVEGPEGMPIGGSGRSESFQSEYDNNYAWVKLQSVWKPGWLSETQFSTGTLVQNRLGYSPSQSRLDDQRVTDILGLKQEFAFEGKRNFFRWGVDLKDLRAEYRYLAAPVDPGDGDDLLIYRQPSGQEYGLYISDRIRVSRSLNIDVGVRWDRETYTAFEDETVSPRINLAYSPGSRSTLRAGWGYFHQPQKIHELQVEDGVGDFFPTQRSEHFTLGFDHGFRNGLELTVNAYRKNMTDLRPRYENLFDPFGFFPEADQDRVRIAPDRAEARGIEFLLGRPAGDRFSWWAGYTLASVEDEIDGDWIPRSWDQRHTLDLGLHFRLGESWNFGVTGSYHSGRPTTQMTAETAELPDGTLEIVPVLGPRNGERYPAFHSMDLRVDRIIPFRQMDFRLFLNITNIYGRRNICCVESFDYTVQPDGSVLVDPREVFGLPSLISFGLTWTF